MTRDPKLAFGWSFLRWFGLAPLVAGLVGLPALAQSDASPVTPYATLDRQSVTYRGPGSTMEKDLPPGSAVIGLILPLQGPQQAEGKALLAAAQLALEEEQARGPLADGRKLTLAVRDESGPWGQASSEILRLIEQDHALVLLTSADGNIAHQAEQLANKISFPILTLASDPGTTATNVPWVFRLVPSDTDQARAFAQRIYTELGLRRILLIAQTDHDGRVGAEEFAKAAKELKMPSPGRFDVADSTPGAASAAEVIEAKSPEAVVLWSDAALAREMLPVIRKAAPSAPAFLCTKAAQLGGAGESLSFSVTAGSSKNESTRADFAQSFQARTGRQSSMAAWRAYEAVHAIATALRAAGPNRVLLRDYFANEDRAHDPSAIIAFDPAGNCVDEFTIVELTPPRVSQH